MRSRLVVLLVAVGLTSLAGCSLLQKLKSKSAESSSSGSEVEDQGMTSELHAKNVKRMVFAPEDIELGKEKPATFSDSFTLAGPLYARLYLARGLAPEFAQLGWGEAEGQGPWRYHLNLLAFVDDKLVSSTEIELQVKWTTYKFALIPAKTDHEQWSTRQWFASDVMPRLTEGKHKVRLAAVPRNRKTKTDSDKVLSEGTFTLEVTPEQAAASRQFPFDGAEEIWRAAEAKNFDGLLGRLANTVSKFPSDENANLDDYVRGFARLHEAYLTQQFRDSKLLGKSANQTHCLFSAKKLDPKKPKGEFRTYLEGEMEVNILCRLSGPARSFMRNAGSKLTMSVGLWSSSGMGVRLETWELGSPMVLGTSTVVTKTMHLPNGVGDAKRAYFYASVVAEHPGLESEALASGGLFWHTK